MFINKLFFENNINLVLDGDFLAVVSTIGDWWLWGKNEKG